MNKNKFSKVSFCQYKLDCIRELVTAEDLLKEWEDMQLPQRKTYKSAGYDFVAPFSFELKPGETILIPSCIRAEIEFNKYLALYPRSGLGFKYRLQLDNSVGIVDSDFADTPNEGHILFKISNCSFDQNKILSVKKGEGFAQGIFTSFGVTVDDDLDYKLERTGGIGSTNTGGTNG